MFIKSYRIQCKVMFSSKEFYAAFLGVFAFACIAFVYEMILSWSLDVLHLKDANQIVCFSFSSGIWPYFTIIYPIVLVVPFAMSYLDDYENRMIDIYTSFTSKGCYIISKLVAAFSANIIVFGVPLFVNLILCNTFFPHNYNTWLGEYQTGNYYRNLLGTNIIYTTKYPRIPFMQLYLNSTFLYNLFYIIIFSLVSGLLGMLIMSISFIIRRRACLFALSFVIVQGLRFLDNYLLSRAMMGDYCYTNVDILSYITPSMTHGQSPFLGGAFVLVIIMVVVLLTHNMIKRDLIDIQ